MSTYQPGILEPLPAHGRFLEFGLRPDSDPIPALRALAAQPVGAEMVVGLGAPLVAKLGKAVAGLRPFPAVTGPGCHVPSTQGDLWCWLRGTDRGHILQAGRAVARLVAPAFRRDLTVDGFKFDDRGLDLSGYEDGTENPKGEEAVEAAILSGAGAGLDGSSFVAAQKWKHDLGHMDSLSESERDDIIGRRHSDNEEFDEAPESAHVKRAAQESFDPEAFMVRRSMPWADPHGEGLVFVAFGRSFDAYEAVLGRMTGQEDGIVDGLFRFTRPLTGGYFWCPPVKDGRLDLSAIGL